MKFEKTLIVKSINKKTQAEMFKFLEVGDKIKLEVTIEPTARASRGRHLKCIKCTDLKAGQYVKKTFNELPKILDVFEFEEVQNA